ncbi:MAG: flagellar basal body L-ring protein FlgH [Aquabacterium sp.]|nr:MAG: flagellar basal body L-ring protein FlgH [Aquabacterium sp.]
MSTRIHLVPLATLAVVAGGCSSVPEPIVQGPLSAAPIPHPAYVERLNTGSIFQPNAPSASLFSSQKLPRALGDTLKVEIAEELSTRSKLSTTTSRDNKVVSKGPGGSGGGLFNGVMNLDASAGGSDSFKGSGDSENTSSFTGKIAVTVVNVLANGNLVVAGERTIGFNNGMTTMRFSGVVNPADVRAGNVVSSNDVVNARLEAVGRGDVSEAASRNWLQRALTKSLTVW